MTVRKSSRRWLAQQVLVLLSVSNLLVGVIAYVNSFARVAAVATTFGNNNENNNLNYNGSSISRRRRFAATADDNASESSGQDSNNEQKQRDEAIVVGGGPVGLATALMLSNAPHNYDVTVYEASSKRDYQEFDPAKAYLYLVNARGQVFTRMYPNLHKKIEDASVPSTTGFVRVPADPSVSIPSPAMFPSADADEPGYWIQRHLFSNLLLEAVEDQERERKRTRDSNLGSITCHFGTKCLDIFPSKDNSVTIRTTTTEASKEKDVGSIVTATASLVVAGDGVNSRVRECLSTDNEKSSRDDESCQSFSVMDPKFKPRKFKVKQYRNPATNLRLKALKLPLNFSLNDDEQGGSKETTNEISYAISGIATGPRNFLRLGCLPCKQQQGDHYIGSHKVRPANAITRPDHEIWKIRNGETMRQWFAKNFPRMNFAPQQEGGMISDQEWERFAKAEGVRFPHDQFSPALQVSFDASSAHQNGSETETDENDCGIVLLGDAAHAFPPSIGQGINAGLADVVQLDKSLTGPIDQKQPQEGYKRPTLSQALRHYEKVQLPETKSLIRLARFGSPYQYSQPHYIDRIRKFFHTSNLIFRLLLNKVSGGLIPPPMIMMVMSKSLTYRQAARRADLTTTALVTTFVSIICFKVPLLRKILMSFSL